MTILGLGGDILFHWGADPVNSWFGLANVVVGILVDHMIHWPFNVDVPIALPKNQPHMEAGRTFF